MKVNECPICGRPLVLRSYFTNYFEYDLDDSGKMDHIFTLPGAHKQIYEKLYCKACEKSWFCEVDFNAKRVMSAAFMRKE